MKVDLNAEDMQKIIEAVDLGPAVSSRLRDRAILELLCRHAMRSKEICELTLNNVHSGCGTISVMPDGAGNKRFLELKPEAKDALDKYLTFGRGEFLNAGNLTWLFLTCDGNQLRPWDVALIVRRYAGKAGMKSTVSAHGIRRAVVAQYLQAKEGGL